MSPGLEAVQPLVKLLSKYSPSGEEEEAQQEVFSLLLENGFENVRRDPAGNVLGEKGERGQDAALLLSRGHCARAY
jgi:putative aminopeptidase FrvX